MLVPNEKIVVRSIVGVETNLITDCFHVPYTIRYKLSHSLGKLYPTTTLVDLLWRFNVNSKPSKRTGELMNNLAATWKADKNINTDDSGVTNMNTNIADFFTEKTPNKFLEILSNTGVLRQIIFQSVLRDKNLIEGK